MRLPRASLAQKDFQLSARVTDLGGWKHGLTRAVRPGFTELVRVFRVPDVAESEVRYGNMAVLADQHVVQVQVSGDRIQPAKQIG